MPKRCPLRACRGRSRIGSPEPVILSARAVDAELARATRHTGPVHPRCPLGHPRWEGESAARAAACARVSVLGSTTSAPSAAPLCGSGSTICIITKGHAVHGSPLVARTSRATGRVPTTPPTTKHPRGRSRGPAPSSRASLTNFRSNPRSSNKCQLGRTRERCRSFDRSVSLARPPNRTCAVQV